MRTGTRLRLRSFCVLVLALVSTGSLALVAPSAAQVPPGDAGVPPDAPRVALVGDSIMLGASPALTQALTEAGFDPVVDAAESRSTSAGVEHVRLFAASGVDALVVMLGANDAGNPDTYRERVAEVIAAADGVEHLYWMTIPEVRDYYPEANRIVAEQLASRPGGEVLDWNAALATGGLTAGDGMHLNGQGASAMAGFVTVNLAADMLADAVPEDATVPPASEGTSPGQATSDAGGSGATGTGVTESETSGSGVLERAGEALASEADPVENASGPGGVLLALALVATVLAATGAGVALWALWNSRRIRQT